MKEYKPRIEQIILYAILMISMGCKSPKYIKNKTIYRVIEINDYFAENVVYEDSVTNVVMGELIVRNLKTGEKRKLISLVDANTDFSSLCKINIGSLYYFSPQIIHHPISIGYRIKNFSYYNVSFSISEKDSIYDLYYDSGLHGVYVNKHAVKSCD